MVCFTGSSVVFGKHFVLGGVMSGEHSGVWRNAAPLAEKKAWQKVGTWVLVRGAGCCSARKDSGTVFLFAGVVRTCGMIRAAVCTGETGVVEWDFYEIIPIFR